MKIPLHYQVSEFDCGPTTVLNAMSYLFQREDLPAEIVRNIMIYCLDCYNMIYNSQPLYLLDRKAEVETLGAGACRMMFTTEKGKETRELMERWITGTPWNGEFTRGHFKRGVE